MTFCKKQIIGIYQSESKNSFQGNVHANKHKLTHKLSKTKISSLSQNN